MYTGHVQTVREANRVRQESLQVPGLPRGGAPGVQEAAQTVQVRTLQLAIQR